MRRFRRVISASRRQDMVGTDPAGLAHLLSSRCPPEDVHSVVIWTKSPGPLVSEGALRTQLLHYDQVFVHLTITGMGATVLEPMVPPYPTVCTMIPKIVEMAGQPARVRLRFDPIVHLVLPDGRPYTNLPLFDPIASAARWAGVTDVTVSWLSLYAKVKKRLATAGIAPVEPDTAARRRDEDSLLQSARRLGMRLLGCCVPGWPRSSCIDGRLLTRLHPRKLPCSVARDRSQRELCGCTKSTDIGWYASCAHGCLYCYAHPRLYEHTSVPLPTDTGPRADGRLLKSESGNDAASPLTNA